LLIAGGKTGGHLFPGIAVAQKFLERGVNREVLFVGTSGGLESRVLPRAGLPLVTIKSAGIRGKGLWAKLKGLFLIPVSFFEAMRVVRRFEPDTALGVGGFVSGPALVAAWLLRVPFAVHEQNLTPGITNRLLGLIADRIFVSFEETKTCFPVRKTEVTGNPVRKEVIEPENGEPEIPTERFGKGVTLLVFGGSQGASAINRAVVDFFRAHPVIRDHTNLIHQAGWKDLAKVREAYSEMGYGRAVVVPFIHKMGQVYRMADLVVCRAGAGTVFELAALGKPAVLIPFPHAAGDHQAYNAAALASRGAAVMLRQSEVEMGALGSALRELLSDREKLKAMAGKAADFATPLAADEICERLEKMAHGKN